MERGRGEGRRGGGYEEFYSIPSLSLSLSSFFLFSFPLSFFSSVLFFLPFLFYPLFFFSLPFFVFSSPSLFFNILRETPMRESIDFESIKRLFLLTAKPILLPFHFPLPPFVRRSGRQKRNNSATREFRSNGKEKLSPPSPPSERKKSRQLYFHQLHRPMFLLFLPLFRQHLFFSSQMRRLSRRVVVFASTFTRLKKAERGESNSIRIAKSRPSFKRV